MIWSAFLIGLFGGAHCVGMCGPIAMALPGQNLNKGQLLGRLLLYNFGRVTTYLFLGSMVGVLGLGAQLAGWQSTISIVAGALILILLILRWDATRNLLGWPPLAMLFMRLRKGLSKVMQGNSKFNFYKLGVLNGFLPCGLVYLAIIGAVAAGGMLDGALYMAAFGIGTIPLLLVATWFGQRSVGRLREQLQRAYPILLAGLGLFLIWRGAQFRLPNEFSFFTMMQNMPMCH